jgi:hypothetical protein
MPPNTVYVGRPSSWGNPWSADDPDAVWWAVAIGERGDAVGRARGVVAWHRWWLTGDPNRLPIPAHDGPGDVEFSDGSSAHIADVPAGLSMFMLVKDGPRHIPNRPDVSTWLAPLRGKDLACWCPLDKPCHADVLLALLRGLQESR